MISNHRTSSSAASGYICTDPGSRSLSYPEPADMISQFANGALCWIVPWRKGDEPAATFDDLGLDDDRRDAVAENDCASWRDGHAVFVL